MRILFFIEALGAGGKERRLLELIHYLKEHTDFVLALVLTEDNIQYDEAHDPGLSVKIISRKNLKRDPRLFMKFYRYCREFKPDIIHTWGFMNTFYAIPSKLFLRIPLLSSMISVAHKGFKPYSLNNLFFTLSCHFSDAIISNSGAGLRAFGIHSRKSRVIYNGVRPERFRKDFNKEVIRSRFGVRTDFMIVMVANISKFKDYDLFLDVAEEIGKIRNDVTLLAVGDGPLRERIEQRILSENISNVILAGKQKNVERIVSASDIGLLCTKSEGISNAIIEYMALGKPVIVSDISGGSREIVVEGETGFCVEHNPVKIVDLIVRLLENEELRKNMGQKGAERIKEYFSLNRMGEEFVSLYNEFA